MQVSRGIEVFVEEVLRKSSSTAKVSRRYRGTTQQKPRIEARSIHQVSRSYRGYRPILDRSIRYRGAGEIVIRKSLGSSTYSQLSRRYRGGVEPAFKNSFSRCEKHKHECNPTCNSTNDPINILNSQNHLSNKILSTWIFENTHTLNKSNQFYTSKNKSRQFSKHTLTHIKSHDGQIILYLHMYQEQQRILRVMCEKHCKIA